jgi:predicted short-subunit dehydrogenase-like oxidoreductase (DUF2520 family)
VVAVASRTAASAERLAERLKGCRAVASLQAVADAADLVFITTPDDAIAEVAAQVRWRPGSWVVHVSGAESLDVLEPARCASGPPWAASPQTFADVEQAVGMPGSTFALEEGRCWSACARWCRPGRRAVELRPQDKALYHAAADLVSNYVVTLVDMATRLWQQYGADPESAAEALLPLLQGTVNNLRRLGLPDALTGPIARGDLGTVRRHLAALEAAAPATPARSWGCGPPLASRAGRPELGATAWNGSGERCLRRWCVVAKPRRVNGHAIGPEVPGF